MTNPTSTPAPSFYGPWQIAIVSGLTGPLTGGWFMASNFRQMGETEAGKKFLRISLALHLLYIPLIMMIYQSIPMPFLQAFVGYVFWKLVRKLQDKKLDTLIRGYKNLGSLFKLIGISLLILVGSVLYMIVLSGPMASAGLFHFPVLPQPV